MFNKTTSSNGGVLRSETYLTTDYEPEEPIARNGEIGKIADAVRPLAKRRKPDNLLVYGPAGVGKTTCVKYVFDRLEEEAGVKSVYINCWQYNTRSSLLTELLIAEQVAENSGDCRQALNTLLRAGRKADQEGRKKVNTGIL